MSVLLKKLKYLFLEPRLEDQVAGEAIRFLYGNMGLLIFSSIFLPAVIAGVFWRLVAPLPLLLWAIAAASVPLMRLVLQFVYKHLQPADREARRWGAYFTLSNLASGLVWSVAIFIFDVPGSLTHQAFIIITVLGMTAGALTLTSSWLPAFHALVLPPLITLMFHMLGKGTSEWVALSLMSILFTGILLRVASTSYRHFTEAVRLRLENLDLIEKLRNQKTRAEQANQAKTQFLASASHDLRQPVHSLALFAEALRYEVNSPKAQMLMNNLSKSIESIDELLSSLLDISKLDARVVKVNEADIKLRPILQKISNEFYKPEGQKNIHFRVRDCDFAVHSDPVLLTNIIRNLVSNAFRYTRKGGILVACRKRRDHVSIEVWDTGVGIPKSEIQNIFNEFYQLENPERDRSKGLGLGLAICRRLCELLKHTLTVQSTPGRGSVFKIQAPLARTPFIGETSRRTVLESGFGNHTVLVVDDEKEILNAMRAVLQSWQCQVLTAGSSREALQLLAENPELKPRLIICDYRLRDQETGTAVIDAIRLALNDAIPAIIMTGDTAPERIREAEASGHLLMHKPIKPSALYNALQNALTDAA
jgi:signal transduction histidine kinase/ActR/RegA family two-component response regulator